MMKPLWAGVAGVALLGAVGATAVVVAGTGGEEEVAPAVQATATSTVSATQGPSPSPTDPATASPTAAVSPAPPSTPVSSPADTLTYSDPTYGYSFDYPYTWYLSPPKDNGGLVILYSYNLANVPPEEAGMPVPKDKIKAIFWVAEGVNTPVEQWLAEGRAQASAEQNLPPPSVISQSQAVVSGRQGLAEVIESDGIQSNSYYIPLGSGRVFVVNGIPADSQVWPQFLPVLDSVRFAS